ncbi:nicotinate-nucleotide--dimethylbenzimidazole phosphoribosyltransferase [Methylonatrum kenyense]|uniref:nicotinate-nucleotide--dimethylbenzimidazole phosphoribosyltransferase n=1 Tax=Methylonatrum kenyense TaxID=455253 RepID=UPI0020BEC939|nr:nicotinate-nucleotide--dimethylbenzimidazole phosphoribosyltransferase [Methylonatrum kenyense]MCK8515375.1 nicotinate-nucleotide--dimethylbenzimidazole phosphoribosyltransferase [Methylonatrum kenyense]
MAVASPWSGPLPRPDQRIAEAARARQDSLTKPPGSLGRLETLAVRLAAQQGRLRPAVDQVWISVFAADHGVCAEGVSAFPQEVTAQMIRNFSHGGGAINVLARTWNCALEVVDLGTTTALPGLPGVETARIAAGTANLARQPAMSAEQCQQAMQHGAAAADRAAGAGSELFIGGEMGIGNTTSAAAVACALLAADPADLSGRGTGVDDAGLARKRRAIAAGLARHGASREPLAVLASLGGFEIAALAGAMLRAAGHRIPVLVDGFIATTAALAALRLNPGLREWLHFSHRSSEAGHARLLDALDAEPLLDLDMRLGEGSGAAVTLPLLRAACALHNEMATFAEADVAKE